MVLFKCWTKVNGEKMKEKKKQLNRYIISYSPELHEMKLLSALMSVLVFVLIFMPQYFGIHIAVDFTCSRFMDIFILLYMIFNPKVLSHFWFSITKNKVFIPLMSFLLVVFYTMVFRADINIFFLNFLEILTFFFNVYAAMYVLGIKNTLKIAMGCSYFFSVYGLVEFVYGRSIFLQFLSTVPNYVTNAYRSGHYRIMGPCGHSLAYGLMLIFLIVLACYDYEKDELYLFKRPLLLVLLFVNVFLTGSRSTLGVVAVELLVILLFNSRMNVKKSLLWLGGLIIALLVFLLLFGGTSIGNYILGQIASVVDTVFGTEFAPNFGIDTETLQNSADYRKALPKIFKVEWLNPFIGRGNKFSGVEIDGVYVHSIDNYYVNHYIKYAYPGIVTYGIYLLVAAIILVHDVIVYKSGLAKMVLISQVFYFINLWWVDTLQTFKFSYLFMAIFFAYHLRLRGLVIENRGVKYARVSNERKD